MLRSLRLLQVHTLDNRRLENFLERHKAYYAYSGEIEIDRFLREILQKANEFVPSEAGSILLDDPMTKNSDDRMENELVFIATFGARADSRLGQRMNARVGIVGHVYSSGVAYTSDDVVDDPFFYPTLDVSDGFQTKSVLCVPIRIESSVCGVLELVNRVGPGGFREKDRRLLEIFADYASISIQNLLDARRAYEVAKRDGLTGLYNERYLHLRLTQDLSRISRDGGDLAVVFLDLDNLKSVNDRHGHLAGSQVLREVGYLLRRTVTDERATLTRYGGDEFVLILPGAGIPQGLELAEAIGSAIRASTFLSRPYGFNDPALNLHGVITASLGVSSLRSNATAGASVEQQKNELLRAADAALYRAKETGKDRAEPAEPELVTRRATLP
ncbi:MAG TPA: sensor domain-containing diguanylate cyclase [Thermoanaerobaculia bacterium]